MREDMPKDKPKDKNQPKLNIKAFDRDDLVAVIEQMGLKKYRAAQILEWIYKGHAASFDDMTNISKSERLLLSSRFDITEIKLLKSETSRDGTIKYLFGLQDHHTMESVLIPDNVRLTLCISSQVGCGQACRFCLTGRGGFTRNLLAYEIVDQALLTVRRHTITNIVLMGMGEPLANFDEVMKALRIITSEKGMGISRRRITLSTAGLVPEIDRLAESGIGVNLAVSLNAVTDKVRNVIMPVNRRYPLKELLAACKRYPLGPRNRITFEYVMLKGVNDSTEDALRLASLVRGIRCKINLIPFNPFPGSEFERPDEAAVARFQKALLDRRYAAPVRESRGRDISAACGQLREREEGGKASILPSFKSKTRSASRSA